MLGKRISFSLKIVLLCLTVVMFTAASIGLVTYSSMRATIYAEAADNLAEVARLNAELIARPFEQMASSAQVIAATPPVEGIMKAREPGISQNEIDNLSEAQWRRRLQQTFTSVLRTHASFTMMRLIGLADGGREIVRVDRHGAGSGAVSQQDLKRKGSEPFMAPLSTAVGPYYSEVTHDREDGVIEETRVPTIRLVYPVRQADGPVFGAIVINADYEAVLTSADESLSPGYRLTVLNEAGDYIVMNSDGSTSPLQFHDDPNWRPSSVADVRTATAPAFRREGEAVGHPTEVDFLLEQGGFRLFVIASVPLHILMGPAVATLHRTYALVVGLAVFTMLVAWPVSLRMTQPLRHLISQIEARKSIFDPIERDVGRRDEIGQLAQAYSDLANDLIVQAGQSMTIFRNAADGILTVEQDGTIISANPAATEIFGFAEGELIGANIERLIPQDSRVRHREYIEHIAESDDGRIMGRNRDVFGLRKTGEKFPLEASLNSVVSGEKTIYVAVLRDITIRMARENSLKRTIAELANTQRNLERSNQELDQFAYVASHDLKAPLRVIDNASRWLEQDLDKYLDEDTRDSMQLLRSRVKRMEQLLDDLLQHSRIGREKVSTKIASGRDIMAGVIELAAIPDGFTVEVDPAFENLELQILPLQTVLLNLVRNAVKHHDKSQGRIRVGVSDHANMLAFSVTDDGPGIDPQYHDKVFQMFQTLKPRDAVEASGIGLAIVKKTVELAGGDVSLVSSPGSGCSFRFTWPKVRNLQLAEGEAA